MLHTLWATSQTAANPNNSDGGAAGITTGTGTLFGSASGSVTAVTFLATTTTNPAETYTIGLWRCSDPSTGVLLSSRSVSAATITAGVWNTIQLTAPIPVDNTHAYASGVWNSGGRYVSTSSYFASPLGSLASIYAWSSGENINAIVGSGFASSRQGLFLANAAFDLPSTQFNATSYFVSPVWDDGVTGGSSGFFSFL